MAESIRQTDGAGRLGTIALLSIGLGLFLRLLIAMQPPERLVPICLADDTFYYLRIAEHILAGDGPTFDGVIATNGYHPLWMLVSLAAVKAAGGAVSAARISTLLLALIGSGCALLMWRLGERFAGPVGGLFAAGFWSLNPFVMFTELMGVEAPLMMLFALGSLLVWVRYRENENSCPFCWALLGGLVGLALLARTDAVLFALPLALAIALREWLGKRRFSLSLIAGGAAVAVVSPWLIYNLVAFGTIAQDSARVLILRERMWLEAAGTPLGAKLAAQLQSGFADYFIRFFALPNAALVFGLVGLLVGAVIATRIATGEIFWNERRRSALPLLGWGAAVWAFYVLYFWQQKFWYFLPVLAALGMSFALTVAFPADALREKRSALLLPAMIGLVLLAGFISVGTKIRFNGYQPWQATYLQAAQMARQMTAEDPELKIGAFNAGILSAFSGVQVVNLDGVVNPDAREAIEDKALLAYMRREGISVLVDHAKLIAAYGALAEPEWPQAFEMVRRFPTAPFAGDVLLLKVKSPEEMP